VPSPGSVLPLGDGHFVWIDAVQSDVPQRPVELLVEFTGRPEVTDQMRSGDRDTSDSWTESPTIRSLQPRDTVQGQVATRSTVAGVEQVFTRAESMRRVEATIHLMAEESPAGLLAGGALLRTGAPFSFQTDRYVAIGVVVKVTPLRPDKP
jgi:hypothetical protein